MADLVNLVGFYADMGVPGYREMCERMYASAENFAVKRIHIADADAPFLKEAFEHIRLDMKATKENLILCKAIAFSRWGIQAEANTVFSDMDVLWQKDPTPLFDEDFDIGVIWREKPAMPIMPYNGGLMLAKPTPGARAFWRLYHTLVVNTPPSVQSWWVEQLALAVLLGLGRKPGDVIGINGANVRIFDAYEVCRVMKDDQSGDGAYSVHFKGYTGAKKRMMDAA